MNCGLSAWRVHPWFAYLIVDLMSLARLDVSGSADPENSLIVDLYAIVAIQVIIDPAVTLGRVHRMDLFYLLCDYSVLSYSFSDVAAQPLVIC